MLNNITSEEKISQRLKIIEEKKIIPGCRVRKFNSKLEYTVSKILDNGMASFMGGGSGNPNDLEVIN